MLLTLTAPASPFAVVIRIITARVTSRRTRKGCLYSVARSPAVCRTSSIFSEYGRVAWTAACARRSLVAATTCMALVIFCVFLMLSIRRTMSRYAGNYLLAFFRGEDLGFGSASPSPFCGEGSGEGLGAGSGTSL